MEFVLFITKELPELKKNSKAKKKQSQTAKKPI